MNDISNPDHVREQYATEGNLETRRAVWHPTDDGRDPSNEAFKAIDRAMTGDSDVLEVGCGTGVMAERINALPGVTLVAIDYSERFVELTAARGVDARQADICYLPFEDDSFDVVYAGWMLYHVRDLDRALGEIRRVLRPGGTFVAVTNGDDSLADLRKEAGGAPARHRLLQRERRVHAVAQVQRRPPPGPRDARGLRRPRERPGLPRLLRRGAGPAALRGIADLRRPRHRLRGSLTNRPPIVRNTT